MKSLIKQNIVKYFYDERKVLLFAIFAFFCGLELTKALVANMTVFEFMLYVLGNHYYVIYYLLMIYIFFSFEDMNKESTLMLIRLKTIKNQYICRLITVFIQASIVVIGHVLIAFIMGLLCLDCSNAFSAVPFESYHDEALNFVLAYGDYVNTPLTACVYTALFMILGLTFISMIIYVSQCIVGRKATLVVIVAIVLDIMLGFKLGMSGALELFFLNNYFIFHHALLMSGKIYVIINALIQIAGLILGGYILKRKIGNRRCIKRIST